MYILYCKLTHTLTLTYSVPPRKRPAVGNDNCGLIRGAAVESGSIKGDVVLLYCLTTHYHTRYLWMSLVRERTVLTRTGHMTTTMRMMTLLTVTPVVTSAARTSSVRMIPDIEFEYLSQIKSTEMGFFMQL